MIQHLTQAGEAAGVIDVKITELQASAQGIPQTFINFFLHEGFQRFAHDFGISRFIPVGTADANDSGVSVDLARLFKLIQEGNNLRRARSPFAPKMTRSHAWAVCVTAMSFSSVDSLVLLPGYICNFLTLHCTVFTYFPKAFPFVCGGKTAQGENIRR